MQWLKKKGLHFISIEDFELIQKGLKAFPQGGVLITIDDGWYDNETNVVGAAEKLGVPISIFISSGPVKDGVYWWSYLEASNRNNSHKTDIELVKKLPNSKRVALVNGIRNNVSLEREAMTVTQLKKIAMSDLVTFGAHSVTHPILINCTNEESFWEIKSSKNELEDWLKKDVRFFSYPNGSYSQREIEYLKSLGYSLGFCTDEKYLTKERLSNKFVLPRFWINEGASNAENICRMVGLSPKFTFR